MLKSSLLPTFLNLVFSASLLFLLLLGADKFPLLVLVFAVFILFFILLILNRFSKVNLDRVIKFVGGTLLILSIYGLIQSIFNTEVFITHNYSYLDDSFLIDRPENMIREKKLIMGVLSFFFMTLAGIVLINLLSLKYLNRYFKRQQN